MSEPTHGGLIIRPPQYVEEASYGVFPANPVMQWIGTENQLIQQASPDTRVLANAGDEDAKIIIGGLERYPVDLTYFLQTSTFAKYATQAQGGGAGTIDKSLSLLYSVKLNGVENYVRLLGTRINRLTLRGAQDQLTVCTAELQSKQVPAPGSASPIGSGSFATDPATNPFIWSDGGVTPVTIGGVTPNVQTIEVLFNRSLRPLANPGDRTITSLRPGFRIITGRIGIIWDSTTQYSNLLNETSLTLTWVLKTGVSVLTLTGVQLRLLERLEYEAGGDTILERYAFQARSGTLT